MIKRDYLMWLKIRGGNVIFVSPSMVSRLGKIIAGVQPGKGAEPKAKPGLVQISTSPTEEVVGR